MSRIYGDPLTRPPVWVERDGQWHPGRLHAWHRTPDGWVAVVSYHADGLQYHHDVTAEQVKQREPGESAPGVTS